jgi:hypothetical protein
MPTRAGDTRGGEGRMNWAFHVQAGLVIIAAWLIAGYVLRDRE